MKGMVAVTVFAVVLVLALGATAEVPQVINYQGRLTDASGTPVTNGTYLIKFKIYGSATGNDSLWSSGFRGVTVTNGLFNYLLGDTVALPDTLFSGDTTRYLGITVGGDPELSPRTKLTTVAYAYHTLRADTADFAWTIANDSVTNAKIANDAVTSAKILDGTIQFADIGQNGAATGQVMKWNGTAWVAANDNTGSGSGGWTDAGTVVHLSTTTDSVGIGTTTPAAKLDVVGDLLVSDKATIGPGHTNTGNWAFTAGSSNWSTGSYSTALGAGNMATGNYSGTLSGGINRARGHYSVICGGGGTWPADSNATLADLAAIVGGSRNIAGGLYSFVGGGYNNNAAADTTTIGGGRDNVASGIGSTVGGGCANSATWNQATVGGGLSNSAAAGYATVGGGFQNNASGGSATVGGGSQNNSSGNWATIGGGQSNIAAKQSATIAGGELNNVDANYGFVGGGLNNAIVGPCDWSVITGGQDNNIPNGTHNVISGGLQNLIDGIFCAIPGGDQNTITTGVDHSMVFGFQVNCQTPYEVVLFDSLYPGMLRLNRDDLDGPALGIITVGTNPTNGNGAFLSPGGVWVNGSSREFKEHFQPVDGKELLEKVSRMKIQSWDYKNTDEHHIGPVAEDFVAAFDVGPMNPDGTRHNKHLAAADVAGVALIGVQELYKITQELEEKTKEIEQLKVEMAQLQALVETLLAQQKSTNHGSDKLASSK